jgi:hypothetical protein
MLVPTPTTLSLFSCLVGCRSTTVDDNVDAFLSWNRDAEKRENRGGVTDKRNKVQHVSCLGEERHYLSCLPLCKVLAANVYNYGDCRTKRMILVWYRHVNSNRSYSRCQLGRGCGDSDDENDTPKGEERYRPMSISFRSSQAPTFV